MTNEDDCPFHPPNPYLEQEAAETVHDTVHALFITDGTLFATRTPQRHALARRHCREVLVVAAGELHGWLNGRDDGPPVTWEQVRRGIAFSASVSMHGWGQGYGISWQDDPDIESAQQAFAFHALAGRHQAAVDALEWLDQTQPAVELRALYDQAGLRAEASSALPYVDAVATAMTSLMHTTLSKLREWPEEHRGHGCDQDPEAGP